VSVDFARARRRSRFEAWLLDASAGQVHARHGRRKQAVIGAMTGTVVEIGPGTGVNMRYYADGVHVVAIEPNPTMHPKLRAQAERCDVDLEIRALRGEGIDVDDGRADAVVGTFVLCGVDDIHRVVAEVHRVLKPGGTFFFLEHVAAPSGTWTRRVQRLVKRAHRSLFNGCEVDRDTASVLRTAGFSAVELDEVDTGAAGLYARHQIVGTAVR
jgi:ubiquinone/menaquinone biosynthesis C-methylase UbiE